MGLEIKGLWNAHLCCMTRSMLDIHLIRHLFPTRWLKIICSPTICFDPHIDQIGETPTLTQMIHGASFGNGAITPGALVCFAPWLDTIEPVVTLGKDKSQPDDRRLPKTQALPIAIGREAVV